MFHDLNWKATLRSQLEFVPNTRNVAAAKWICFASISSLLKIICRGKMNKYTLQTIFEHLYDFIIVCSYY